MLLNRGKKSCIVRQKPMRVICHILRAAGYLALLPYLAYLKAASFHECLVVPIGVLEILLPWATFMFILGYGNRLSGKVPFESSKVFWTANFMFHAFYPSLVIWRDRDHLLSWTLGILSRFSDAFFPECHPSDALYAVGELSFVIIIVWMPIAAVLSLVALILSIRVSADGVKNAVHGTPASEDNATI